MKKIHFTLLLIGCFIAFSCSKQSSLSNDCKKLKLNGLVKTTLENNYEAVATNGKITKGNKNSNGDFDTYLMFNEAGFITQKRLLNTDCTVNSIYMYEYKKNLLSKLTKYTATENIDKVFVSVYDEKTDLLTTQTTYNAFGKIESTDKYLYKNNLVSEQQTYGGNNGSLVYKWTYEYDTNGNKIKDTWYIDNATIQTTYKFDNKNQLIEQQETNKDNVVTKWKFEYDEKGNLSQEICIFFDNSQTVKKYIYQYDENNNWIEKTTIENNQPTIITERKIEYYK
jgi:hypothetical protein